MEELSDAKLIAALARSLQRAVGVIDAAGMYWMGEEGARRLIDQVRNRIANTRPQSITVTEEMIEALNTARYVLLRGIDDGCFGQMPLSANAALTRIEDALSKVSPLVPE